ncbi:MAG: POTRA domain-containing protein [Rhodocyclaceae bacterium]|nr:POTRA domain-containing protein [Rhodocyclaceae bacterium]
MRRLARYAWVFGFVVAGLAHAQDEHFNIQRFQVEGNTLLPQASVDALVAPFLGSQRDYGDIQKALEALENAYRASGYGTVQVYVPEQELTQGIVRLQVTEGVIGRIAVIGNQHFDEANIRATLPDLQEGKAPNMRQLSENIQLANENPAKQIEVTLGVSEEEGKVDAKVNVADEKPEKYIVTLDNTGTSGTGTLRAGFAYQNANVANSDQVMTLAYTTSPDAPSGVKVDIFSVAYRVPFYSIGDSLDLIYGKSSVNAPMTTTSLGAGLGTATLNGKGDVIGVRWNHYFARRGEYTSKLITGFDDKYINTRCTNLATGADFDVNPPTPGNAACTPYTVRPLSLTYTGQRQSPGQMLDYSLGFYQNWATGTRYAFNTATGAAGMDRYSVMNGDGNGINQRATPDSFNYLKLAFSYLHALPADWAGRAAFNGQFTQAPLPTSEQLSIAGATAVRGFNERAVAMDKGFFVNLEIYTPELASRVNLPGSLKAVGFYDFGRAVNYLGARNADLGVGPFEKAGIASIGAGLRYSLAKDISARFDLACVVDAGPANVAPSATTANTESRGDWRAHFAVQVAF